MLTAIRQWVIRTMMKSKGQTGVVQTLPKRDLIELNTQITAQKLMQGGIDPQLLKNADQVENAIIAIESRPKVQEGIRSTKSAKVMDMEGKEIKDPKNIMGGKEINQQTLNEELMKTENPYSDLVNTPRPKTLKEREAEVLAGMEKNNKEAVARIRNRKIVKDAIDNASPGFVKGDRKYNAQLVADDLANKKFGKDFYDLDQRQQMDLYDEALEGLADQKRDMPNPEDFATGGRAGYADGTNYFTDPDNLKMSDKDLRYLKSLSPAMQKAFLRRLDIRDMTMQAEGGRAGFDNGGAPSIKLFPRASGRQVEQEVGPGIKISERDLNYGITGLLQGDKFFGGAEIDKGKVKIDVLSPEGDTLFKDTISKPDAVNFILGMGDSKGDKFQIKTDKDFENMQLVLKKSFAEGGRAGFKSGLGFFASLFGKGGKMFRKKDDVPTSVFSEKKGPLTIKDLENIPEDQLRKIRRTQELGLYDETPEILKAGNLFERFTKKVGGKRVIDYDRAEFILNRKLRGDETLDELLQIEYQTRPGRADGGIMRLGLKEGSGMTRRTFLKLLGGMAAIPIVGKFLKPIKTAKGVKAVPIIKTDNVPGKPEWFDALVNKVITEGDDVTKKFATGERQSIHQKTLDDGSVVRVTEDIDDGAVRVEYDSDANVFEDTVQLQYKKPLPDEGDPRPAAEFTTAESGPVGRQSGPDDFDIDIDEVGGTSISDLTSDVSKLKEYATGKKPTLKEFVESKKRKDKARRITEDPEAQSDAVIARQGEALDYDDYASGGIARMLGE